MRIHSVYGQRKLARYTLTFPHFLINDTRLIEMKKIYFSMYFHDRKNGIKERITMLFTSLEFVFWFLPIVLIVNFVLPKGARNYWLMLASFFFYGWGEPKFLIIMILSILFNYFSARKMIELREEGRETYCRYTFVFAIAGNLALLFNYKYMNLITKIILRFLPFLGEWVTQTKYVLPVGISFFTFQAMSYLVDVYRGTKVQRNVGHLALYISLFPQLIAGPIVRYDSIVQQIEDRRITMDQFVSGVIRFLSGFNKKVLLANLLAIVADTSWNNSGRTIVMAWLGAFAYSLQIFFDFSGYSDMAIGLGKMFGFNFLENFNYPYISKTVSEFWRRWHISLGSWFRDYVYIPLGGSRVNSKKRLIFNLAMVWVLTGVWHGAGLTFIAWGVGHAFFICAEKLLSIEKKVEKGGWFAIGYRIFSLLIVLMLWVLFRSPGMRAAWQYLLSMLGLSGNEVMNAESRFYLRECWVIFLAGVFGSTPLLNYFKQCFMERYPVTREGIDSMSAFIQFALFIVSVSYLVMNAHNPFIYFNF